LYERYNAGYPFNPIFRLEEKKEILVSIKPEDGIKSISQNVLSFL
jgi:hypothetical protein